MNSEQPARDPIDEFLSLSSRTEATEDLRKAIQSDTLAIVRRHRRMRRAVWLPGLAACYAAGILTMVLLRTSHPEATIAAVGRSDSTLEAGSSPSVALTESPKLTQMPDTALALEWQALDCEDWRPDLFRIAGDKYLVANDLKSAMRCYRGALEGASDEELLITVNDNWLFMSLKEAKLEEKRYAMLNRP